MAKITILEHPNKINKDNSRPVVLRVSYHGKRKYYHTGYKAYPGEFKNSKFVVNNKLVLNVELANLEVQANVIAQQLDDAGKLTWEQFNRHLRVKTNKISVWNFFNKTISNLERTDNIGNAGIYKTTRNSLFSYHKDHDLTFMDITISFLKEYRIFMISKGLTGNGAYLYMRTLRALYNDAIEDDIVPRDLYPFRSPLNPKGFNISNLRNATDKRAIPEYVMKDIMDYSPGNELEHFAKDIFLFSFLIMGINFSDIAYLKYENFREGRIVFTRAKTRHTKTFSVKLNLVSEAILMRNWKGQGLDIKYPLVTSKSFKIPEKDPYYLFPILNDKKYPTAKQKKTRIQTVLKIVNKNLQIIGTELGLRYKLTTYVARHTYATILKDKGIDVNIISQALGHADQKTTQIYLNSFANPIIDKANETLLQVILSSK